LGLLRDIFPGRNQMQFGEFLGDRNNPVFRLLCQECGEVVFTTGKMTFDNKLRRAVLEVEPPDHEHEIIGFQRVQASLA
jgi:hypothetical protein